MPAFDIIRQSRPKETFRVKSIIGKFDLQQSEAVEHFKGSIDLPEKWNIGLIVGHSGTGKSTIANELFGARIIKGFEYTHDNILDDMPQDVEVNEIAKTLTAVGFSSPPLVAETVSRYPKTKNIYKGHRLVVLPDYQGVGIGSAVAGFVPEIYKKKGYRYLSTTSNPSLVFYYKNSKKWKITRIGRVQRQSSSTISLSRTTRVNCITVTAEYIG